MNKPSLALRIGTVATSVLLVTVFICYRSGAFDSVWNDGAEGIKVTEPEVPSADRAGREEQPVSPLAAEEQSAHATLPQQLSASISGESLPTLSASPPEEKQAKTQDSPRILMPGSKVIILQKHDQKVFPFPTWTPTSSTLKKADPIAVEPKKSK